MTSRVRLYIREAASRFAISPRVVMSRSREWRAVGARKAVMCRLRTDGFSVGQIAEWLGCDHSTVSHHTRVS